MIVSLTGEQVPWWDEIYSVETSDKVAVFYFINLHHYLESSHKRQLALILNDALGIKDAPNFLVIFLIDPVEKAAMRCFFDELIYLRRASIIPDFRVRIYYRLTDRILRLVQCDQSQMDFSIFKQQFL